MKERMKLSLQSQSLWTLSTISQCAQVIPEYVILPAVDHHWSHVRHLGGRRPADKSEDRQGVLWDTHVRPLGVMILEHCPLTLSPCLSTPLSTLLLMLQWRKNGMRTEREKRKDLHEGKLSNWCLTTCYHLIIKVIIWGSFLFKALKQIISWLT